MAVQARDGARLSERDTGKSAEHARKARRDERILVQSENDLRRAWT